VWQPSSTRPGTARLGGRKGIDSNDLVTAVRARLRTAADPSLAPGQQAYMKSEMPFLGVRVPQVRRLVREIARGQRSADVLRAAAERLWDGATHREERYAALALLALRPLRGDPSLAGLLERFARSGAWWDLVDEIAHRVADLHDAHPAMTAELVRRWSTEESMWVRRLAILGQLGRRDRVDRDLLADVIEPSLEDPEPFVRKAIGWALREVSYVDPDWVGAYVDAHPLSSLSRREALRGIARLEVKNQARTGVGRT
jgi:3-methyladenine DNA glycosylase AlkD